VTSAASSAPRGPSVWKEAASTDTCRCGSDLDWFNGCCTDEELFFGFCYKKCTLLTDGRFPYRWATNTCCNTPDFAGCVDFLHTESRGFGCTGYGVSRAGSCPDFPCRHSVDQQHPYTVALSAASQWLYSATFEIQQADQWGSMAAITGGHCSRLVVGKIKTEDVGTAVYPEIGYHLSGLRLQCRLIADNGNLVVNFGFADAEVYVRVRVSPRDTPVPGLSLPMGEVKMTQCEVEARLSYLDFGGSAIPPLGAKVLREAIVAAVAQDANMFACRQIEPLVVQRASKALNRLAKQLMPLLEGGRQPPSMMPTPGLRLVDFTESPPLRLLTAVLKERAAAAAELARRSLPLEMPVDYTLSSATVGLRTTLLVRSVRAEGLDSFLSDALALTGEGSKVDLALGFSKLRFIANSEVIVNATGGRGSKIMAQQPYKTGVNLTFEFGNTSMALRILAMLSKPHLESLEVDQLQQPSCLASAARVAVAPPAMPLQLQEVSVNSTPVMHINMAGGVEAGLAEMIDTTVAALLRGYGPVFAALVPGFLDRLRPRMDSAMGHFMDALPPCRPTMAYFGPGSAMTSLLLCGAAVGAALAGGALCGSFAAWARGAVSKKLPGRTLSRCTDISQAPDAAWMLPVHPILPEMPTSKPAMVSRQALEALPSWGSPSMSLQPLPLVHEFTSQFSEMAGDRSLSLQAEVPEGLAFLFPVCIFATACLFLYADLGLGTVINLVIDAGSQSLTVGPAFAFSLSTCAWDAWKSGAYTIAALIVILSGVWPFAKLGLLTFSWYATADKLSFEKRERILSFVDGYGKYSLIDSWLAILALNSYRLSWRSQDGQVAASVDAVPMDPFFVFVVATICSLVLGHIASETHRRAKVADDSHMLLQCSGEEDEDIPAMPLWSYIEGGSDSAAFWPRGLPVAACLFVSLVIVWASAMTDSFEVTISGVFPTLMLDSGMRSRWYGLYSLGMSITDSHEGDLGLVVVQVIFIMFALAIPLLLLGALLVLWMIPLRVRWQRRALIVCKAIDAWASFDVFVLAVAVSHFEFGRMANFLVYHDNVASICAWVQTHFHGDCFHIECELTWGFACLSVAGFLSYAVPKAVFALCDEALASAAALERGCCMEDASLGVCEDSGTENEDASTAFVDLPTRSPSLVSLASRAMVGFCNGVKTGTTMDGPAPQSRTSVEDAFDTDAYARERALEPTGFITGLRPR